MRHAILFLTTFAMLARVPSIRAGDGDKVFKLITAEQTEALLQTLKIEFKKVPAKTKDIFYYDFQRSGHTQRLYWFGGKDLMLDVVFGKMPLDQLNAWNVRAKFSRACLHKDDKGEFTALEANLDVLGGITEGTVKQFLNTFDSEVKNFAKFASSAGGDETIYAKVTNDKLETILQGLNITYKKIEVKGGGTAYEFQSNNHQLQLVNFGGDDLMIDAHFKKLKLEDVNQYNLNRKFIRCVAYNIGGKEHTSLETNLDCVGGVCDSIVRNFILGFETEVKEFTKYVQGK